jgi:hypothetical protein
MNNVGLVTGTLPATASVGDIIRIVGYGSGGWKVAQNSGQTLHFGATSTTTGTGGHIDSSQQYSSVSLKCTIANTDWVVTDSNGTYTGT